MKPKTPTVNTPSPFQIFIYSEDKKIISTVTKTTKLAGAEKSTNPTNEYRI